MIVSNAQGDYQFIRGGAAFSFASVADKGYGIVHATFLNPPAVPDGFNFIAEHLRGEGRPMNAVCGIELRSPRVLSSAEFGDFNANVYRPALLKHNLLVDEMVPMTRSNLAPVVNPPAQAVLFAFSYTVPQTSDATRNFVLAGAADEMGDPAGTFSIVRAGETSDDAMREKAVHVIETLRKRLGEFNLTLEDSAVLNMYTAHNIFSYLPDVLVETMGRAGLRGMNWYYTRPPVAGLEIELDARRTVREIFIP